MLNNIFSRLLKVVSANYAHYVKPEEGVTLLEYSLAVALFALVILIGMPTTERQVEERIEEGRELWTEWNFEL